MENQGVLVVCGANSNDINDIVGLYREGRWTSDRDVHPSYAEATYKDDKFYSDYADKLKKRIEIGNQVFVAKVDGKLAGFAVVSDADEYSSDIIKDFNKAAEIHQIYVKPEYQARGIGKVLFTACKAMVMQNNCKVANDNKKDTVLVNVLGSKVKRNEKAIGFYFNMGARPLGTVVEHKERSGAVHELHCLIMGASI